MKLHLKTLLFTSLLLIGIIGIGFGYWVNQINHPNDANTENNVTIGTAQDVDTQLTLQNNPQSNHLVPVGCSSSSVGPVVEYLVTTVNITWSEKDNTNYIPNTQAVFRVSLVNYRIGGVVYNGGLFNGHIYKTNLTVSNPTIEQLNAVSVTTMDIVLTIGVPHQLSFISYIKEPANRNEFLSIHEKNITTTYQVTFINLV